MSFWQIWSIGMVISFPFIAPMVQQIVRKRMRVSGDRVRSRVVSKMDQLARRFGREDSVEAFGGEEELSSALDRQLRTATLLLTLLMAVFWPISLPLALLSMIVPR